MVVEGLVWQPNRRLFLACFSSRIGEQNNKIVCCAHPKTNIAAEKLPSGQESSLPTTIFFRDYICETSGGKFTYI